MTTLMATASYLFYAHAVVLWIIFAARLLGGIGAGNIGVAYAYIADVTEPRDRAKSMGLIGVAFGLGFIFGPPVGAALVKLGGGSPQVLGYTAAALSFANFLYVYFVLQESVKPGSHEGAQRAPTLHNFAVAFSHPALCVLLAMFFATNFGFSNLESTFFRFAEHQWLFTQQQTAYVLAAVGVMSAIVQGGIIRVVIPIFGEVNLLRFAYFCQVPGLILMPWAHPWGELLGLVALLGIGGGLSQPSMSGLISRSAPGTIQGGIFGVTMALGAFARILGPAVGNYLFDLHHWLPYVFGGCVVFIPLLASWTLRPPAEDRRSEPVEEEESRLAVGS